MEGTLKPEEFPPEARKYLQHNPTEGRRLLAEAGYPDGLAFELFGTPAYGGYYQAILEALPAMLRPAGFKITLRTGDIAAYQHVINNWDYGPAALIFLGAGTPPIERFLGVFASDASPADNRSAVKDPEYDAIIAKIRSTFDPIERLELARRAQVRMLDQVYFVLPPSFVDFIAVGNRIQGDMRVNGRMLRVHTGWMFHDVWLKP